MYNLTVKISLAILVVLLAAVFFWQPLTMVTSKVSITNDFVLQTAKGYLDSRQLRGKVLAIAFASASCGAPCTARLGKLAQAYELLNLAERDQVRMILVSVDPEHDTPARIAEYAGSISRDMIGGTGNPEEIMAMADKFGADYRKAEPKGGSAFVEVSALAYIVDMDGRFVSVLNEMVTPEKMAAALRQRLPVTLPPQ